MTGYFLSLTCLYKYHQKINIITPTDSHTHLHTDSTAAYVSVCPVRPCLNYKQSLQTF